MFKEHNGKEEWAVVAEVFGGLHQYSRERSSDDSWKARDGKCRKELEQMLPQSQDTPSSYTSPPPNEDLR